MKLYQTYLSPFPTRVRLLLYAKGIEVEILEPAGFHGDTRPKGEYLGVNPIGRIPALVLDDGRVLPESEVISSTSRTRSPSRACVRKIRGSGRACACSRGSATSTS